MASLQSNRKVVKKNTDGIPYTIFLSLRARVALTFLNTKPKSTLSTAGDSDVKHTKVNDGID